MGYTLYKAENVFNGEMYIGCTKRSLMYRKIEHKSTANNGKGSVFHDAIRLWGFDAFVFMEICKVKNHSTARKLEESLVVGLNTIYPNGYNKTEDGGSGKIIDRKVFLHSEKTREKMRKAKIGYKPVAGFKKGNVPWCKNTKDLCKPNSGSFVKGQTPWNKGKAPSEETRQKMRGNNPQYTCPHCGKIGRGNAMKQHHFNNCKTKEV